ncbi:hypothetical protein [Martelella radicis]|uniref:PD-(D/E)XK nuclease superfamily protein n=1 Tax=Martelella radicis TaxID=1397476 RepID=A0A7W6KIL7_9HYPH|nr:hypothetical protein [Martelella radicis]MBB4121998.1 hypothetical protein [Martelella radicis]
MDDVRKAAVDWLNQSPLYRMSLGSRELFHTNFLAWLFEQYPSSLAIFGVEGTGPWQIRREYKHIDIAVFSAGETRPRLIIENKVKDVVRPAQLNRYAETTFPDAASRVVLSLVPFDNSASGWLSITYLQLHLLMTKWLETEDVGNARDSLFIEEYINLIRNLGLICESAFDAASIENEYWFGRNAYYGELSRIGFHDTLSKYQAQIFARQMGARLSDHMTVAYRGGETPSGKHVLIWTDLFRATPCASFVVVPDAAKHIPRLEVQIQGRQYRHMFVHPELENAIEASASLEDQTILRTAVEQLGGYNWLFGREKHAGCFAIQRPDGSVRHVRSAMRKPLNSYRPNVVYQYLDIDADGGETRLTVDELFEQTRHDLEFAFALLERG